ncbi:helix-turn-helix domain-containing protein [Pseudokineococcus sp. 1T1Z-3]|uniref:helix-turn-helix domain-containing protein n=1 Tax=Pseudokineococcus sp. 1T1Z-3 TaxID=3132745 RepID=UPI0030B41540
MDGRTSAPLDVIAASLARERRRAGISLTELARRAGVAKSTLSQLEQGAGNPGVETLWALSTALEVPLTRLLEAQAPQVHVVRAGEGLVLAAEASDYLATLLAPCPPGARRDVYRVVAEPGRAQVSAPHLPDVREHVVLAAGRARVGPAERPVELAPGDYVTYPGDARHVFEALSPGTSAVLVSEHV